MPISTPKSRLSDLAAVGTSASNSWALPSGQTLAEFALRSGILAPTLLSVFKPTKRPTQVSTPLADGSKQ